MAGAKPARIGLLVFRGPDNVMNQYVMPVIEIIDITDVTMDNFILVGKAVAQRSR